MTLAIRRGWERRAACFDQYDIMFSTEPEDIAAAKELCASCPVRRHCLNDALDGDVPFGIWGGTDFEERTRMCPVCRKNKAPHELACSSAHRLERLARLVELQRQGDRTVSVSRHLPIDAPTHPGCLQPRGRSHSTAKAYKSGCRCAAARLALYEEWAARVPTGVREQRSVHERFMSFVERDGDHWRWKGSLNGSGYANFWDGKRTVRAHIFAYETFIGPVPESMHLRPRDALASRPCVNPEHYETATR